MIVFGKTLILKIYIIYICSKFSYVFRVLVWISIFLLQII